MTQENTLLPFTFDNHVAHGAIVHLEIGVADFLGRRPYSDDVLQLVGQAMAAMPLLTTHMHFEGRINLQFQGNGPVKLLVAQIDHHLDVRGMANAPDLPTGSFAELLSQGVLALMLEPTVVGGQSTQALVPIDGTSLAGALESYFEQSEQLPTLVRLAARGDKLAGFMLQRLPLRDASGSEADWEHLRILAATLDHDELLDTPAETILHRLFHEEPVRVFQGRPVQVTCHCGRDGISRMLLSLGRTEVDEILAEEGRVSITCEFCGREYTYSRLEVDELFAAAESEPANEIRH